MIERIKKACDILSHNQKLFIKIILLKAVSFLPDSIYIRIWYRIRLGRYPNLKNPKTFNEKLQWLKLNYRRPILTTLVDKYAVKEYVANLIGKEHIIPTIGIWDKFDDIDFEKLPDSFVLKCTHDSGGLVICKDKKNLDKSEAKRKIEKSLARDFYKLGREWPYKNVPRRIIAENYVVDNKTQELRDYKFFSFMGVVKYFKIDFDRYTYHRANYYDRNGCLQKFGEYDCLPDYNKQLAMPQKLDEMISLAEKLSEGYPFMRVDFYEVNGCVYFGEITFFPASGQGKFVPEEWDTILGNDLKLPN